jgi:hypothetical protein
MADFTDEDDALLAELGIEVEQKETLSRTPREERIIAGFEEIQRFVETHDRLPRHDESGDIFERIYAVRLDQLRGSDECRTILAELDSSGLLDNAEQTPVKDLDDLDDAALLAELGLEPVETELTQLRFVRAAAEKNAAEDVAQRDVCPDFVEFKPLFEKVQSEINDGIRVARPFETKSEIEPGRFFIVQGQKAYVAEMGDIETTAHGRTDARLRVIFDNGTQSTMLMRSLQRALNADENGRRISEPVAGPLFLDEPSDSDEASGTIYVLASKSDHPYVEAHRALVHKIGVTNLDVRKRIAGAQLQPTFLMAPVEILREYKLFNVNRVKLEALLHKIFAPAQIEIKIPDRFGRPVTAREWFLVPIFVVDEAVERIKDGSIKDYAYDPERAALVLRQSV